MTAATDTDEARRRADQRAAELRAYRDDGPIARALGQLARGQLPPLAPALVAAVLTVVALSLGAGIGELAALLAPVSLLLLAGPSSTHPHGGRLDWLVPPLIRAIEYGYLAVLGFALNVPEPLVYTLLAVLVYHHYDTVYRTRQGLWPPEWVFQAGLGWDGRMLIAALAAVLDVTTPVYAALALYLGVLFGWESVRTWVETDRRTGKGAEIDLEEEAGA
ncbi:DUF5941 domain-containing protein [Actinocorallia sp. A-T 12471]|uniref:DUF5941 domain-containing protein n=1 Tax=Actinocorallia sp. A-T 12471 TaxID=3089813 RepID=UPI0029D09269|nr:DUF5941 domain-containing protein [Actinocorallia sp. A-T 12471]MDX6745103.1 DUF5941 domain-containing protein [Actinocorallia sp. A-T 12471]